MRNSVKVRTSSYGCRITM